MRRTLGAKESLLVLVALIALGLGAGPAFAAHGAAAGRKHATKAAQLAAKNKCKSAVVEFTKAYKSLKDPTLLFNRAECYRKLDQAADALKDYEQFLAELPEAPNRASVQSRVVALRAALAAVPAETPPEVPAASPAGAPAAAAMPAPAAAAMPALAPQGAAAASQPVPQIPRPSDALPVAPIHRAEKWTD
jgi:tetratricopeptide (TPR) repeat protein